MTTWDEAHEAARAAIADEQWHKALRTIGPWLGSTAPALDDASWQWALSALATAAKPLGKAAQGAATQAAAAPDDPRALYDLGHALIETRRPELSIAILARAVERAPVKKEALTELVAGLELQGRNADAIATLDAEAALVAADPLLTYLRAFNAVSVADVETARRLLPAVQASEDERVRFMAARLARMIARADALAAKGRLAEGDLRGWHYVLTGGVLADDQRLAKTWDSPARVKAALRDLGRAIEALELDVPALLHPPERNCALVANAASALLGRPVQKWYGGDERGLIVVYDARDLIPELRKSLVEHRAGQPLYMRAAEHTTEQPTAPDVLGYLYERNTSPWGPGFTPANDLIDTSKIPDDELVRAILDAEELDAAADANGLRAFCAMVRGLDGDAAPAAWRDSGQRDRLWVGSPVAKTSS